MVLVTYMFAILGMIAFNHRVYALGDDAFQRYLGGHAARKTKYS